MPKRDYKGLLFIGDPHLASRVPGFRKDEYPAVSLNKLTWCLDHAREHSLLPAILGDLFHWPRDNDNWLLGELLELLGRQEVIGIYGNHDARVNELDDDDSFSVIVKADRLRLVDGKNPWRGDMSGQPVVVGGTSWGQCPPIAFDPAFSATSPHARRPLVVWMTHHDVIAPGHEGRFAPYEIPGVDVVVNGHIHRKLEDVQAGSTCWITPGNICRIKRSDISRQHVPSVLRIDILAGTRDWRKSMVEVPFKPFAEVFHAEIIAPATEPVESAFVQGLAELQSRRTPGGSGLIEYLQANLAQFNQAVAHEVLALAKEVTEDGTTTI
jgi:predicted phosphodiesterase